MKMDYIFDKGASMRKHMLEVLEKGEEFITVAICDGKMAGFNCASCHKTLCDKGGTGEGNDLYVKDEYRRMGIGTKLMESMEDEFRKRNLKFSSIFTGKSNITAKNMYLKRDYKERNVVVLRRDLTDKIEQKKPM